MQAFKKIHVHAPTRRSYSDERQEQRRRRTEGARGVIQKSRDAVGAREDAPTSSPSGTSLFRPRPS